MDRLIGSLQRPPLAGPAPRLQTGRAWPLGAHWDGQGVNFAVYSAHASQVVLCLFDAHGATELAQVALPECSNGVWHGYLPDAAPGLVYGLRAHGAWRPDRGHRFNPNKLLLDPYAREVVGHFEWHPSHFGADAQHPLQMNQSDNAGRALKARVVHDAFDWEGDRPLHRPLADSVLYEVHVRGFTRLHPGVSGALRGSYAGLASNPALAHLKSLGITAVSLLPVHQHLDEQRLAGMGLSNYWGYNSIAFFSPDPHYASAELLEAGISVRDQFRGMVKRLHAAGIEVILDVVYNHTAEGDHTGPSLSFRGLDNFSYYRLQPDRRDLYENPTGCGNALDIRHPRVLQLVMDSLRYWVQEMHVDGFRFDLAPILGRGSHGFERDGPFFKAVTQDPVLAGVKMIAEPWDIGYGGYQAGNFPRGWLEWNDRFRDTMRAFWLGGDCTRGEFAQRLCASSDMFQSRSRPPAESVNYVVSHDGFTLADLVSFDLRHNLANGEDNRDGHGHNLSWNCGLEGATGDPDVLRLRQRLKRALLATTLLSQGTPMLAAGDELGHSQNGNNNPYCQDNPITWIDWVGADASLLAFTTHLIRLRRELLPLGVRWYTGLADRHGREDLGWLRRNGQPLQPGDWGSRSSRVIGALIGAPGRAAAPLLLLFNADSEPAEFALPRGRWTVLLDSREAEGRSDWQQGSARSYPLQSRSVVLLASAASD